MPPNSKTIYQREISIISFDEDFIDFEYSHIELNENNLFSNMVVNGNAFIAEESFIYDLNNDIKFNTRFETTKDLKLRSSDNYLLLKSGEQVLAFNTLNNREIMYSRFNGELDNLVFRNGFFIYSDKDSLIFFNDIDYQSIFIEETGKLEMSGSDVYIINSNELHYVDIDNILKVDLENNENKTEIFIYPNPAKNIIFINSVLDIKSHEMISISGQIIDVELINNSIDVSSLHPGVYIFSIVDIEGKKHTQKVVVN